MPKMESGNPCVGSYAGLSGNGMKFTTARLRMINVNIDIKKIENYAKRLEREGTKVKLTPLNRTIMKRRKVRILNYVTAHQRHRDYTRPLTNIRHWNLSDGNFTSIISKNTYVIKSLDSFSMNFKHSHIMLINKRKVSMKIFVVILIISSKNNYAK